MRIILCSGQPVLAEGLRSILARQNIKLQSVVAQAGLPEAIAAHHPNILLIDLSTDITVEVLSKLMTSDAKVVLWVDTISTEFAFQAMGLGVSGILRKTLSVELLAKCLRKVKEGELWFEKALTDSFLHVNRVKVTRRESDLINLAAQGLKNKEIATALGLSEGTVKVYMSRLFFKLGMKDRWELGLYGLKNLATGGGALSTQTALAPLLRSLVVPPLPKIAA